MKPARRAAAAKAAGAPVAAPTAVQEPKVVPSWLRLLKRLPFTTFYVVLTLLLAIVFTTLWNGIEELPIYQDVAYGLPAFEDGRWLTLIWGNFFALTPFFYVYVAGAFAFITGFAEWNLGTKRTVIICVAYQIGAVLLSALVFLIFRHSEWDWAVQRATETDVGFSAGMLAVASVASATVRPPWRLRMRLAIWAYVLFSIVFVGQMADAEHVIAVLFSMPFSSKLAGPQALKARALPTRHELRLLAMVGVLLIAAVQLLANFVPGRLTPFGPPDDEPGGLVFPAVEHGNLLVHREWSAEGIPVGLVGCGGAGRFAGAVRRPADGADHRRSDHRRPGQPGPHVRRTPTAHRQLSALSGLPDRAVPRSPGVPGAAAQQTPVGERHLAAGHRQGTAPQVGRQHDLLDDHLAGEPAHDHRGRAELHRLPQACRCRGCAGRPGRPAWIGRGDHQRLRRISVTRPALVPYIFSCGRSTADVTDALGWQSVQVAEDNLIDLPTLEFKGKKWQDIRTALNKAPKEGVTFRMVTLADESWGLVRQVENLSQEWLGDKELPEMGFTLGGVTEALDRMSRWALPLALTARCTASRPGCRCTAATTKSSAGRWISCAARMAASGRRWNS